MPKQLKSPSTPSVTSMKLDRIERPIPNALDIVQYTHCGLCIAELPAGMSPQDYRRYDVGMTPLGLQVWCTRHNANVVHIDFQGYRLPANTTRKVEE